MEPILVGRSGKRFAYANLDGLQTQRSNFSVVVAADSGARYASQRTPHCNVTFCHHFGARVDVTDDHQMSGVAHALSGAQRLSQVHNACLDRAFNLFFGLGCFFNFRRGGGLHFFLCLRSEVNRSIKWSVLYFLCDQLILTRFVEDRNAGLFRIDVYRFVFPVFNRFGCSGNFIVIAGSVMGFPSPKTTPCSKESATRVWTLRKNLVRIHADAFCKREYMRNLRGRQL